MNEALRQQYLKRMGFTPWVARRALPGAAPSPVWEDSEEPLAASEVPASVAPPAQPSPEHQPPQNIPAVASVAPVTVAPEPEAEKPLASPPAAEEHQVVFGLEVHRVGPVWVLAAQEDPYAPALGRFEAPLMANLLKTIGQADPSPRRFFCPLTNIPMSTAEAHQALQGFIQGLVNQSKASRLLFLLPEPLNQQLLSLPRFQAGQFCDCPALVISSLAEMLADPALHKRRSWHAMHPFLNGPA